MRSALGHPRKLILITGLMLALGIARPLAVSAATSQSSTESLVLSGGALSVGALSAPSISGAIGGGAATGALPSGTWSDATGTGTGWNGTIAMSLFHYQGTWVQTAGAATGLGSTAGAAYTAVGSGYYTVTITSYASPTLSFSYAGMETGSGTATLAGGNTTSTIGSKGMTIVWGPSTTAYAANMAYTIKAGNLSATALALADGGAPASITATGGTTSPVPVFTNTTATVTGGSGADPTTTVGAAVKFVTAPVNQGLGSYTVSPQASVTTDLSVWAASYVAQVTMTIASGP
jgi:hypothetical protein